jgi:site-specific DNA-adenine methylase
MILEKKYCSAIALIPCFSEQDHYDLAKTLNNIQGKAVVSHDPHPILEKLYENWYHIDRRVTAYSKGITKYSKEATKPRRIERLYFDFKPIIRTQQQLL